MSRGRTSASIFVALVPVSGRFFEHLGAYLDSEWPSEADTDRVFLLLKRPRRDSR
jgi:hypothetical protein